MHPGARKHVHEESFPVSAERLFALLHTPAAIRQWWGAERVIVLPNAGGIWVATWGKDEDLPDYTTVAIIRVFEPPTRMVLGNYRVFSKDGTLPFQCEFETEFLVCPQGDGASLRVTQDGFPADPSADDMLSGCETGWRNTFSGIRTYLE